MWTIWADFAERKAKAQAEWKYYIITTDWDRDCVLKGWQ
jgi:hypothetical protein